MADLNTYNHEADLTDTDLGVSMGALIELRNAFMNPPHAPAATADNRHIFLVKRAFQRKVTDVLPSFGASNLNRDTATLIVHELFHVAGLDDPQVDSLNQRIHENCGFKGMDY